MISFLPKFGWLETGWSATGAPEVGRVTVGRSGRIGRRGLVAGALRSAQNAIEANVGREVLGQRDRAHPTRCPAVDQTLIERVPGSVVGGVLFLVVNDSLESQVACGSAALT